jgi:hypothetical protein
MKTSEELEGECFRRGCDRPKETVVVAGDGNGYYTELCTPHRVELERRAGESGGYAAVNAEDSGWHRGIPDNAWGWRIAQ